MRVDVSALVIGVSCAALLLLAWAVLRAVQMGFVMWALHLSDPFAFRRAVMHYVDKRKRYLNMYDFVDSVRLAFAVEVENMDKSRAQLEDKNSDAGSDGASVHSTQDGLDDHPPDDS